jgi:hypothetical protein
MNPKFRRIAVFVGTATLAGGTGTGLGRALMDAIVTPTRA